MRLSPHFTLAELTTSSHPDLQMPPTEADRHALVELCDRVLEPVRDRLGVPLRVTSGFRSEALNAAISGARMSQHCRGEAADVVPVGLDVEAAMATIAYAVRARRITLDQAICYPGGGFIHLSWAGYRTPRNQILRSLAARGSHGPYIGWVA